MDPQELLHVAFRAVGVYALALVVIRLSGKRTVGNFTAFDFLVALMLGEVVDEIIYGDVPFLEGAVAIGVIALLHYGNSWLSYWDHGMDRILEGSPTVIIAGGRLHRAGMRKERMNENEVMSELRRNEIADIREVRLAVVEDGGTVTVLREDWAEPLTRADLDGDGSAERVRSAGSSLPPRRDPWDEVG